MKYSKIINTVNVVLILLLSLSSSLFSQWYKVSAVIDSETLNDIIIVNDSIIISVGDLGTIKRSSDFGTSWTTVRGHYSFNDLTSIAYCNGIAMACGKHSELLLSKDFGLNWEKINSSNDEMFNSIAMSDEFGLIVGNNGKIFKIDEDFENTKLISSEYLDNFNDVIIINDSLCFAVGDNGLILRSDDAGENWYAVESQTNSKLYCITKGMNNELLIGGSKSVILKSKDNYNSFVNEIQGKYSGYFKSLAYVGDSVIIAGFMEYDGIERHAFSTDYGLTFKSSTIIKYYTCTFCYSLNKSTGFCCGLQGAIVRYKPDRDLNKENFNTWGFTDLVTGGSEKIYKYGISGINETILTSYDQFHSYISYDSGIVFQKVYDSHNLPCMHENSRFINKNNILIIEDSMGYANYFPSITKFNINDSSYSRVYLYSDTNGLKDFTFKDSYYIVAYKYGKKFFYLSEDEADSWNIIEAPCVYALSVIDNGIIYVLTKNNSIYYLHKTYNNCISWDTVKLNIIAEGMEKLFFLNRNIGWLLISNRFYDRNNKIFKTTDAGNTWHLQWDKLYTSGIGILDIKFVDENNGLACGNMGLLLETSNGGETWNETLYKDSPYLDAICELYYPSKRYAYITDQSDVYRRILDTLSSAIEIDQSEELSELKFYPNPANNKVKIIIPDIPTYYTSIEIYDALGRQALLGNDIIGKEFDLDIEGLINGAYLVVLRSPKGALTGKLFVIR